ncbi:MAG: type II toxin-antitoxin system prevent-host-death family antitoxin [Egibacteraceae bacterium]
MAVSASQLRQDIYRLLDQVLETGIPLEIERRGKVLRIVPAETRSKLDRVVGRPDFIVGDPDEVVHMDWSGEWKP